MKFNIQFIKNTLLAISYTIQSIPSNSPSPVTALQGIIPQCLVEILSNYKNSLIYSILRAPYKSYLLQNINRVDPTNFSYFNKLWSSFLQISSLILSEESTTHISPSVCSK